MDNTEVPRPKRIDSLKSLMRLSPINESYWSIYAIVLNGDLLKSDGTLDDTYGMLFPLDSFKNKEDAERRAKKIIEITGYPTIFVARYGVPVPIGPKVDPQTVVNVDIDTKGKIRDMDDSQHKKDIEDYEKRAQNDLEITKEAEEETDSTSIEYYKRQCYLAIVNRSKFHVKDTEAKRAWENYKMREENVRKHFNTYPEHERDWLPYFKEKLLKRGELELYKGIENAYTEIREELLD